MVGSAIVRRLKSEACKMLTADRATLDLTRQEEAERCTGSTKPDAVIVVAAKVGGIALNSAFPVAFLADNLAIALNVIRASYAAGVKKFVPLWVASVAKGAAPSAAD
jgi:GDP-L-fucose synthase